jgi:SAM-dependent methyltransferase/uncharacterized protein YnzC (UPF0291/DUF896 family)
MDKYYMNLFGNMKMADLNEIIKTFHMRSFLLRRRRLPGEAIELEVRVGVVPHKSGTHELWWINAYNFCRQRATTRLWSQFISTSVSDTSAEFRMRQYKDKPDAWQMKKTIDEKVVSDQWCKVSLASEAPSHQPMFIEDRNIRYISRHSFLIGNARIDFSKVYSNGEITNEIEVEYNFDIDAAVRLRENEYNLETNVSTSHVRDVRTLALPKIMVSSGERSAAKVTRGTPPFVKSINQTVKEMKETAIAAEEQKQRRATALFVSDFIKLTHEIIAAMFNTPLPFNFTMLAKVSTLANAILSDEVSVTTYLDRRNISEAQTLNINHMNNQTMFKGLNENRSYNLSLKTDGERRILIICEYGTWLLFPPYQAALLSLTEDHLGIRPTIIDGELVGKQLYVLDTLFSEGTDVRRYNHIRRLEMCNEFIDRVLTGGLNLFNDIIIMQKVWTPVNNDNGNFFGLFEQVWRTRFGDLGTLPCGFPVDGVMMIPIERPYQDATDPNSRVILKWKPEITIDLKVRKTGDKIEVYTVGDTDNAQGVDILFTGSTVSKFVGGVDMDNIDYNRNAIVEFKYVDGNLVAVRTRPDKSGPNSEIVATGNWTKMSLPNMMLTYETMVGHNNILMKKYHNRINRSLYNNALAAGTKSKRYGKILLDIGTGLGAFLNKVGDYGLILCVEPNEEYITGAISGDGLKIRLRQYDREFRSKVKILQAYGQDWAEITEFVTKHVNEYNPQAKGRVDVISMMDSLTFFFDPARENLKGLARTVRNCLKRDGLFIWKMLDGDTLRNKFAIEGDTDTICASVHNGDGITKMNDYQVRVNILPWIKDQVEYMTSVHDMKRYLGLSGTTMWARDEPLLSAQYIRMSGLYSYGSFTNSTKGMLPSQLIDVFGSSMELKAKSKICVSMIEAIESIFTEEAHIDLLPKYITLATTINFSIIAPENEPPLTYFETANQGALTREFLSGIGKSVANIISKVPDDNLSLALICFLDLDIYLINTDDEVLDTNAVKGSEKQCVVIVQLSDNEYQIKRISSGSGTAKTSLRAFDDDSVQQYIEFQLAPRNLASSLERAVRKATLETNKLLDMSVNVYPRLLQQEYISIEDKLNIIANILVAAGKNKCRSSDLEGIQGLRSKKRDEDVRMVNKLISQLINM